LKKNSFSASRALHRILLYLSYEKYTSKAITRVDIIAKAAHNFI
jgi:hypothetical protein